MEYNTARNHLIMREYGRNIQRMIEYILTLKDREHRQQQVMAVIELMGTLQPHLRNVEDFRHKLWDHLFLVSDFKLDVDSPYPIPTRETLKSKPERLPYPKKYPRNRHFGKNLEMVMDKAIKEENPEKKEGFTQVIGNYMKLAYSNWHKESVHDDAIKSELAIISQGALQYQPGAGGGAVSAGPNISYNVPGVDQQQFRSSGGSSGSAKRKSFQQNKFKSNTGKSNKHNKYKNRNK
ncbi:DUF4290 domain-containing protein [Chitinophaga cymbidii]|uniref:DUF4290 domain-containing protein n=1 Tax=Chitinophaga cymbidii TaxID=1096750 RepID=A0A512RGM1_9BACT|nr:DUF4290 domain-containing protein [Chitinophaga cymbidii]GEP94852.1 hypothetical protein CCY01nite_11120 [Chitinophaga cymbidii]